MASPEKQAACLDCIYYRIDKEGRSVCVRFKQGKVIMTEETMPEKCADHFSKAQHHKDTLSMMDAGRTPQF